MNSDPLKSTTACGCDEGAGYMCQKHKDLAQLRRLPIVGSGELFSYSAPAAPTKTTQVWVPAAAAPAEPPPIPWTAPLGIQDSGKRVTYASGSMRDPSEGKIKWSRITFGPMMRRWAQHLTNAEVKYPDPKPGLPNFMLIETEEERLRYKESAFRHFMAWWEEDTTEDHAAALFFNVNGVAIIDEKRKAREGK